MGRVALDMRIEMAVQSPHAFDWNNCSCGLAVADSVGVEGNRQAQ
jgi:hypothetical protein